MMVLSFISNFFGGMCQRRAPASRTVQRQNLKLHPWQACQGVARKRSVRSPPMTPPRTPQTDEVTTTPGGMMTMRPDAETFVSTFCNFPAEPKSPWANKSFDQAQNLQRCMDGTYTSEWRNLLSSTENKSRCSKVSRRSSGSTNSDVTSLLETLASDRLRTPSTCSIRPPPGLCLVPNRSPSEQAAHQAVFKLKALQATSNKRFVVGFREVGRMIATKQAKVVVAPNLEMESDGVVASKLKELEDQCSAAGIPMVHALTRATLGEAIGKNIAVSVLGILDTNGADEEVAKMLRAA